MYKSFLSVISSSGELGDGLPDGILELIVLLAMMLIGGIVAVVVVSIVKKHKAQTRIKFGLSEPTLFSDEKFQYDPNWAATKQAKRQKFQDLPHLKQELIKGATITETRKGGFEDSCKRMAAKPLYNPASARQLATLFLSELQDNSAEWRKFPTRSKRRIRMPIRPLGIRWKVSLPTPPTFVWVAARRWLLAQSSAKREWSK